MAEWLKLKNIPIEAQRPPPPGVLFDVVVSPYDVPEAVRGFKTQHGRFRIEFRYIDGPEPHGPVLKLDDHVTAMEGRFTSRLLALEVDLDAIGARSVGVAFSTSQSLAARLKQRIQSALDHVAAKHTSIDDQRVMATTRTALRTREDDLINQLAGV
jgi:hypothetical protein